MKELFSVIIGTIAVCGIIVYGVLLLNESRCNTVSEFSGLNTQFKFNGGCYVEVKPGKYIHEKRLQIIDLEENIL